MVLEFWCSKAYLLLLDNIVKEILKLCPSKTLVTLYKLSSFDTVDDFLQKVAVIRGKLKKGGIVDIGAAARIVLHDWNEGIFCFSLIVFYYLRNTF